MDSEVRKVLAKYLPEKQIEKLQDDLMAKNCIIYHSQLPRMNEIPVLFIDATPNEDYPIRILTAYRKQTDCRFMEDTNPPQDPLLIAMNENNNKRATILDKAIEILRPINTEEVRK